MNSQIGRMIGKGLARLLEILNVNNHIVRGWP